MDAQISLQYFAALMDFLQPPGRGRGATVVAAEIDQGLFTFENRSRADVDSRPSCGGRCLSGNIIFIIRDPAAGDGGLYKPLQKNALLLDTRRHRRDIGSGVKKRPARTRSSLVAAPK